MLHKSILSFAVVALSLAAAAAKPLLTEPQPLLRVGIIADCQYGECDDTAERSYRASKDRLRAAIDYLNIQKVALCVSLGDIVENDPYAIDSLLPILDRADSSFYHILGNHDFYADTAASHRLHRALRTTAPHYGSIERNGVRIVMLNSNARTLYAADNDSLRADAQFYADSLTSTGEKVYHFNGAIDTPQIAWLENELIEARSKGQIVVLMSHHPIRFFLPNATIRNSDEMCDLIDRYSDVVVAHISGHLHYGGRTRHKGVHYIIMKGMVQKETSNFATTLSIFTDHIELSAIDGSKFSLKFL